MSSSSNVSVSGRKPDDLRTMREAMVAKFTERLPGWLRQRGVQPVDLADAVQEAHVEVLEMLRQTSVEVLCDDTRARHELMRIVSRVAVRMRRRVQRDNDRLLSMDDVNAGEMASGRDEQAQVEARVVALLVFENLDEPTRALIYAHVIEGRTHGEIAQGLCLKEDTVEKRVLTAKQRFRAELEQLERSRRGVSRDSQTDRADEQWVGRSLMVFGITIDFSDPFNQALFDVARDISHDISHDIYSAKLSTSTRRNDPSMKQVQAPTLRQWHFVPPHVPTTALMGALAFVPASMTSEPSLVVASSPPIVSQAKRFLHSVRTTNSQDPPRGLSQAAKSPAPAVSAKPGISEPTSIQTRGGPTNGTVSPSPGTSQNPSGIPPENYGKFLKTNLPEGTH